jgi:hypothetical protein
MSAVVEFVEGIGEAVGDVIEFVGDAVENVGEVIVDTIEYVVENPEVLAIAIAAPYAIAAAGTALGASAATISMVTQPITAAAITASQGGDIEDIGKAALGSFIGQPLGQMAGAQASKVIGSANAAQNALSSAVGGAVGSAAGAVVTGADVGESALFGAAGSAGASLARAGATSLGAEEGGRAAGYTADVGEALGRSAAGGNLASELVGAGIGALVREGDIATQELRQPTIKNATAYFPPISPEMAALAGSRIDGSPVSDIELIAGIPNAPKMFPEGDMVINPTIKTGDLYTVRNEQGEVFQARDVTYQDGTVQRIIFDPNTQQYQQQILQEPSVRTGNTSLAPIEVSGGQSGILANPDPDIRTGQRATDVAAAARQPTQAATGAPTQAPTEAVPEAPTNLPTQSLIERPVGTDMVGAGEQMVAPEPGQAETPAMRGEQAGEAVRSEETAARAEGGTARPVEEMTGAELLGDAIAGEERGAGRGVGEEEGQGAGGEAEGELAAEPVDLNELTDQDLIDLLEESMAEDTPLIPPDDTGGTANLDVRTASVGRPRGAQQRSISPRVVGTSPAAAIIGQKEPIFGGEENAQSDVWNTRSLRLRKALGL